MGLDGLGINNESGHFMVLSIILSVAAVPAAVQSIAAAVAAAPAATQPIAAAVAATLAAAQSGAAATCFFVVRSSFYV